MFGVSFMLCVEGRRDCLILMIGQTPPDDRMSANDDPICTDADDRANDVQFSVIVL